jgi:5-methyltetrahydropteroyltriglutamate--homocysteine methyltransferase
LEEVLHMTRFDAFLTGLHCRSESVVAVTQDWERRRVGRREVDLAIRRDVDDLVSLQESLGFEYVSDGQMGLRWQDIFTPFTAGFSGVRKGPLVRWFNTNTFFYSPVVTGEIRSSGSVLLSSLDRRVLRGGRPVKVSVPDPLTFCELSSDLHYGSREKLLFAYCDALAEELKTLSQEGVKYVQFSSPSLVARFVGAPVDRSTVSQVGEGIRSSLRGTHLRSLYHTYFGDASPYLPFIFDSIPTDDLGFDLTETDVDAISPSAKGVVAGVADGRSSYVEPPWELAKAVSTLRDRGSSRLVLAPSCDLRHLPRSVADEKMRSLAATRALLEAS